MPTRDYVVGYGKPPVATQFQKGRSGNPKGRPKKAPVDKIDIREVVARPVKARRNGKTVSMSTAEAILRKEFSDAIGGDMKAAARIIQLCVDERIIAPGVTMQSGGVLRSPPGVDFGEWVNKITYEIDDEEEAA